jgi:hypothetical protein
MMNTNTALITLTVAFAVIAWPLGKATAGEPTAINPTGTWKVTTSTGQAKSKPGSERTLKLKLEGGKLTGTLSKTSRVNGETIVKERVIEGATLRGNEIAFTVTFPVEAGDGPDVTTQYRGQMNGDTIKGKLETEWMGHIIKRDWEAKRAGG